MVMCRRSSIGLWLLWMMLSSVALVADESANPTIVDIQRSLSQYKRNLRNIHIECLEINRGAWFPTTTVHARSLWLRGDEGQQFWTDIASISDWDGTLEKLNARYIEGKLGLRFPEVPFTSTRNTPAAGAGTITAFRSAGEIRLMRFQAVDPIKFAAHPYVGTVMQSREFDCDPIIGLPYLSFGRGWHEAGFNPRSVLDAGLTMGEQKWQVVGHTDEDGRKSIELVIFCDESKEPVILSRHAGELFSVPTVRITFSVEPGLFPCRVYQGRSMLYNGKRILFEQEKPLTETVLSNFQSVDEGWSYPGLVQSRVFEFKPVKPEITADDVLDEFLRDGRYVAREYRGQVNYENTLMLTKVEVLDYADSLWPEITDDFLVHDAQTKGMSFGGRAVSSPNDLADLMRHPDVQHSGRPQMFFYLMMATAVLLISYSGLRLMRTKTAQ